MSEQLTNLERAVLEMMLAGENSELKILREQFQNATVETRETTGCGFFTNLKLPTTVPQLQRNGRVIIDDIFAHLPNLKHGAGFMLFVDNGAIDCLEGFCYDESWPDSTADFKLSYLKEVKRGSGGLTFSEERDIAFALKGFTA